MPIRGFCLAGSCFYQGWLSWGGGGGHCMDKLFIQANKQVLIQGEPCSKETK